MGLRGETGPLGQYKTPGMLGFIRAQRGRARSALFSRVIFKAKRSNFQGSLNFARGANYKYAQFGKNMERKNAFSRGHFFCHHQWQIPNFRGEFCD